MARSYRFSPSLGIFYRDAYMRTARRTSSKKKGRPNQPLKELHLLWDDVETIEEVAAREWNAFIMKEVYGCNY